MIEVFLWGKANEEAKYACVEMINHLGVSCTEISDLEALRSANSTAVLILPEASKLSAEELGILERSAFSVIFVNGLPEIFQSSLKLKIARIERPCPPGISGILKAIGLDPAPFFYDFPVLESETGLVEKLGEIEVDGVRYDGVLKSEPESRPLAIIIPQIFRSAAYLLMGSEETLILDDAEKARLADRFGRIDGRKAEIAKRRFLGVPIINVYEELLLRLLLDFSKRNGVPFVRKWLYPRNLTAALCITHDVEYAISVEAGIDAVNSFLSGKLIKGSAEVLLAAVAAISKPLIIFRIFKSRRSLRLIPLFLSRKLMRFNPVWNFEVLMNADEEFGAVSSFFFLANTGPRDSDYDFQHPLIVEAMNLVQKHGFNVSFHGSFNSYIDREQLQHEKSELEDAFGAKVRGVRQHYSRFKVSETWRIQEDAGLLCDSSFGYAQLVGFRAGTCLPFKPFDHQRKKPFSIVEVPRIIEDGVLLQDPYMALSFREAFEESKILIETTTRHHGVLTLGWHECFDRERTSNWLVFYKSLLRYSSRFNLWRTTVEDLAERYNIVREIVFEKLSASKSKLEIEITSPDSVEDFTLKVHAPTFDGKAKIIVNQAQVGYWRDKTDETFGICLHLQKGKTNLTILFKQERKEDN